MPAPKTLVLALFSELSVGRSVKFNGILLMLVVEQVNEPCRVTQMLPVPPWGGYTTLFIMSRLWPPSVSENVVGLL